MATHAHVQVATCTDMGTEMGLAGVRNNVAELAPPWARDVLKPLLPESGLESGKFASLMPEDELCDECGEEDELMSDAITATSLFPNAMQIPGLEHICDNLLHAMHTPLQHWASFYQDLHNISGLLENKFRRERFIAQCLHGTAWSGFAQTFDHFPATLLSHRWHNVLQFIKRMSPLLPILQSSF